MLLLVATVLSACLFVTALLLQRQSEHEPKP
jgi:hypothetical protein